MQHLKYTYNRVFPKTSIRRFILDQIISWAKFLGYYGSILLIIILAFYLIGIATLYFSSNIFPNTFNHFSEGHIKRLVVGFVISCMIFAFACIVSLPLGAIGLVIMFIYEFDYKVWCSEQQKYIVELEKGVMDQEAVYIPVKITKFQRINYYIFPLGSVLRYIVRMILIIGVLVIILVIHGYFSLWFHSILPTINGPNNETVIVKWYISVLVQMTIGLILFVIYAGVNATCMRDWQRFVVDREGAVSKR